MILSPIFFCVVVVAIHGALGLNPDTQYTPEEKEALRALKTEIIKLSNADYQKLDSHLMHFLRRKKLDVSESVQLLRANYKWRKDNKIDRILQEKQMVDLENKFPISLDGVDKEGRPTLSYLIEKWDVRKIVLAGRQEEIKRYQIYILERITLKVYKDALAGKDVSQFNVLVDLSGFDTRRHACLPCLQGLSEFVPLLDRQYPNIGNAVILVNAPRAFGAVLSLVKGLLDPVQQNAIQVYGYDKPEWRKVLKKLYNDDQVPPAFGGTRNTIST